MDISPETNVDSLLEHYLGTMKSLEARHPRLTFVYCTIPLTRPSAPWKRMLNGLLGKGLPDPDLCNIKRFEYNELLRKPEAGKPLFDIALVESTLPDGSRETFTNEGTTYEVLAQGYALDDGHLNDLGSDVAARALVASVAHALRGRDSERIR